MPTELLYQLALTQVPNIGDVQARLLVQQLGTASAVFATKQSALEKIDGVGQVRARSIKQFNDFHLAEAELKFVEKYRIQTLFLTDEAYPKRLLNCYDAPTLLFYKGAANLNHPKVIAIVGTRNNTDYGRHFTEQLLAELATEDLLIISGLALGIDSVAHKAAIKQQLPTVGVVGHGIERIYPASNTALAKDMVKNGGGLLTEFFSDVKPDKHNFPLRNRIVAGLSDATLIIETDVKGGSMITAKLADSYNRDVFALPGRTTDKKSSGCNYLIKNNRAMLLHSASDLLETLGWSRKDNGVKKKTQRELFIELSPEENALVQLLREKETVSIDEFNLRSGLHSSAIAAAILNLELQGIIRCLPGKLYRLV